MQLGRSLVAALSLLAGGAAAAAPAVDEVIERASAAVEARQLADGFWSEPSYLGPHYVAQYYLVLQWLGRPATRLDPARLAALLLARQLPNGSWQAVPDPNHDQGDLGATIVNYWTLKAMGHDTATRPLAAARAWILAHGGLDAAPTLTKALLAAFGNAPWRAIPRIPLAFFDPALPLNADSFAQWVTPHLFPLAYLRAQRATRDLGERFRLDELGASHGAAGFDVWNAADLLLGDLGVFLDRMLARQQPAGSFGGHATSTVLTAMAIGHHQAALDTPDARLQPALARSLAFVERLYLDAGDSSYLGNIDDGRLWDTALLGQALLDARGERATASIQRAAAALAARQQPSGGFPFGDDFEHAPDTDDTAEVLLLLHRAGGHDAAVRRGLAWLADMQNDDGGYGAFAKNNDRIAILDRLAGRLRDSADLWDDSSADVTAHVLEAFGRLGHTLASSRTAARGAAYLRARQDRATGSWEGRWGVNRLYATSAAVVGLLAVGEARDAAVVERGLRWLVAHQNADGGFGESTLSYTDAAWHGRGLSTPTQTAWVLLALVAAGDAGSPAALRAVEYLQASFDTVAATWRDASPTGTGHPGLIYMVYPSYAQAFPLMALSRWRAER